MNGFKNYNIQFEPRKLEIPKTRKITNVACIVLTVFVVSLSVLWSPAVLVGYILGICLVAILLLDALVTWVKRTMKSVEDVEWEDE